MGKLGLGQSHRAAAVFQKHGAEYTSTHSQKNEALHILRRLTDAFRRRPVPPCSTFYLQVIRRPVDVVVAAAGLAISAPLLLAAAVAIKLDSAGPAFYWQERVGQFGRPFRLLKLRTMVENAEADGQPVWAQEQDPRITRVGCFLRRSRLDEVPQLWNVLRGEMSLIGPRPERPEFVALLIKEDPLYESRHVIRPGLTGWAQVRYKYGSSVDDALTKLEYDLYYIQHQSPLLDLLILLKTLIVILQFKGT